MVQRYKELGGSVTNVTKSVALRQSRAMSLVESVSNVVVGYSVAVLTQMLVFPWFGLPARISDALAIGGIFTIISVARSYLLRRLFDALLARRFKVLVPERPVATRAGYPRE
jgi:hypothetical protein